MPVQDDPDGHLGLPPVQQAERSGQQPQGAPGARSGAGQGRAQAGALHLRRPRRLRRRAHLDRRGRARHRLLQEARQGAGRGDVRQGLHRQSQWQGTDASRPEPQPAARGLQQGPRQRQGGRIAPRGAPGLHARRRGPGEHVRQHALTTFTRPPRLR